MKVIILNDRDYELLKAKIQQEFNCARMDKFLMLKWEKDNTCLWQGRKWIRKRSIEAARLKRILGV